MTIVTFLCKVLSAYEFAARTGPAGYWKIPGGPVASKNIMIIIFLLAIDIIHYNKNRRWKTAEIVIFHFISNVTFGQYNSW